MTLSSHPMLEFPDFTVQTLSPGVHAVIARQMTGSIANAGIIDLGNQTLIFDTFMTIPAARELQNAAIQLTGRPASYVVNSHPHPDHVHGNIAFGEEATIVSSSATRVDLLARGVRWLEQTRQEIAGGLRMVEMQATSATDEAQRKAAHGAIAFFQRTLEGLPTPDQLRYPTLTFEHQLTLHGSARSLHLIELGGGHSPSDSILWLPDERIAFTADVVVSGGHLVMEDGDPEQWLRILDEVDRLGPAMIVPGHGRVQTEAATLPVRQYIKEMLDLAARAAREGTTPELPEAYRAFPYPQVFAKNMAALMQRASSRGQGDE